MSLLFRQLGRLPRLADVVDAIMPLAGVSLRATLRRPPSAPGIVASRPAWAVAPFVRCLAHRRYASATAAVRLSGRDHPSLAPGVVVQFRRGDDFLLGMITRPNSRGWQVEDAGYARGARHCCCVSVCELYIDWYVTVLAYQSVH